MNLTTAGGKIHAPATGAADIVYGGRLCVPGLLGSRSFFRETHEPVNCRSCLRLLEVQRRKERTS